jgi:hypothetical protein
VTKSATPRARRVAPLAAAVALVGAAALAIAYFGFDVGSSNASSRSGGANSSDAAAKDASIAAEGAAAADVSSSKSRDAVAAPARTPDALEAAPQEGELPQTPMVHPREGTIVVLDRDGEEHAEESGTFQFERYDPTFEHQLLGAVASTEDGAPVAPDPARAPVTVAVVRGRFRLDADRFRSIQLGKIELGGRLAVDDDVIQVAKPEPIHVSAQWVEPVRLHVRDNATHAELDDVDVVLQTEWTLFRVEHPGVVIPENVVGHGLRSPILLQPPLIEGRRKVRAHFWVSARGHAWRDVGLGFDDPGDENVELEPVATLTVVVARDLLARAREDESDEGGASLRPSRRPRPYAPTAFVRLRRRDSDPEAVAKSAAALRKADARALGTIVAEIEARDVETRFDRLAPDELYVTLESGNRDRSTLLAVAEVTLHASESPSVSPTPVPQELVAVAGTLFVPASWDKRSVVLTLAASDPRARVGFGPDRRLSLSAMAPIAAQPGTYRWRFEGVTPGSYELIVDPTIGQRWLDVGPEGVDGVVMKLPEVAHVTAHVVDAASGAPVEVLGVSWNSRHDDGWSIGGTLQPQIEEGAGDRRLRCASTFVGELAAGVGSFYVSSDEWRLDEEQRVTELRVGDQQVDVRVRRSCGIDVICRVDGKPVRWKDLRGAMIRVEAIGETAALLNRPRVRIEGSPRETWPEGIAYTDLKYCILSDDGQRFIVPSSGWYRVAVPKLEGFADVAPVDVFVEKTGFVSRTIDLVRE